MNQIVSLTGFVRLDVCEALRYCRDESTLPVRYMVSEVDSSRIDKVPPPRRLLSAGKIGDVETVYLGGIAGFSIVGAMRYHLRNPLVPQRHVLLAKGISVVAQFF
jgi:hypothetical protein